MLLIKFQYKHIKSGMNNKSDTTTSMNKIALAIVNNTRESSTGTK